MHSGSLLDSLQPIGLFPNKHLSDWNLPSGQKFMSMMLLVTECICWKWLYRTEFLTKKFWQVSIPSEHTGLLKQLCFKFFWAPYRPYPSLLKSTEKILITPIKKLWGTKINLWHLNHIFCGRCFHCTIKL